LKTPGFAGGWLFMFFTYCKAQLTRKLHAVSDAWGATARTGCKTTTALAAHPCFKKISTTKECVISKFLIKYK
jgi:hypothetical protein